MERQTRQLLEFLADDLTDDLIARLSRGETLETELQRLIPSSRQTIGRRLAELELWGIVVGEDRHTPGPGRPTRAWRLASAEVVAFLGAADEMLLRLLEERARRHREAIRPLVDEGRVRRLRS
jgi:DNA-binding HxlR family transcriptional regulator